ncbi:carbohydrate ABC transporter permease [Streptomyces sp. ME19-01-6]|uniref:carbohydrate ABC transporter permease n=1 Tax=Streptomyces sp. ME19-01-6 TaxID=3028686 RepID=UPI0029B2908F|nr:carbohydrate ABC transporter permease [Streptomyces sp. ME19-01-6]MDX3231878.1 carbohydrate ABC transporter permease [Streptomyces sp. ME19-01-6]
MTSTLTRRPSAVATTPAPATGSALRLVRTVLGYACMLLAAAAFLLPIVWMVGSSFKPGTSILNDPLGFDPATATWRNWSGMFDNTPILRALLNTGIVVAGKGGLLLVFSPLAGYGFAKFDFPFKNALFGLVLLTLMLPTLVLIIPLLLEMSQLNWINSFQALILPGAVDAFSVFWMRQTISEIPDELLDAARIDGCGPLRAFWSVVVPVLRPALAALAVLSLFNIYNDLVWPIVAINDQRHETLAVLLAGLSSNVSGAQAGVSSADMWGQLMAACTFATIPTVLLFMFLQRHFIRGLLAGSSR